MENEIRAVNAVRIYWDGLTPMADLKFAYGEPVTIQWNDAEERAKYADGINAYTLIYDEREKPKWKDFGHNDSIEQAIEYGNRQRKMNDEAVSEAIKELMQML